MKKKWISFVLLISAMTLIMCKAPEGELKKVTESDLAQGFLNQDSVHLQVYGVKPISEKMYVKTYKNYKIGPVLSRLEDFQRYDRFAPKAHFVCQNLIRFILTATHEMRKNFLAGIASNQLATKVWDPLIKYAWLNQHEPLFMLLTMDPDFTNASGQRTSTILNGFGYTPEIKDELMLKQKKQSKPTQK